MINTPGEGSFFGAYGDSFTARDSDELREVLSGINTTVPQRSEGRTSAHRERYCVVKYLSYLLESGALDFPITVTKNPEPRSPDFFVVSPSRGRVGIEHTDAGSEEYQHAVALAERDTSVQCLELPEYASPRQASDLQDVKRGFRKAGEKLSSSGWEDDEAEQQWAGFISDAISKKVTKATSGNYDTRASYELLIYDYTPLMALDYPKAISVLRECVVDASPFGKVTVLSTDRVLYDLCHSLSSDDENRVRS